MSNACMRRVSGNLEPLKRRDFDESAKEDAPKFAAAAPDLKTPVTLYTFDPKAILERDAAVPKGLNLRKSLNSQASEFNQPFLRKTIGIRVGSFSPDDSINVKKDKGKVDVMQNGEKHENGLFDLKQIFQVDKSQSNGLSLLLDNDVEEYKQTSDYMRFASDFEGQIGKEYSGLKEVCKKLAAHSKQFDAFIKDLPKGCLGEPLVQSKISRELKSLQNELVLLNNYIESLNKSKENMKTMFCLFQMKIKKQESLCKDFQEAVKMYFNPHN
eukprot:TRINITY_DN1640_c0_g1_i9.p1 TRINITY_DN1640_c0_g1~~TRINITY_DN1640_c0_g1_i9.p1  ORF type:complete len:297 (-),score=75.84 TRINITY_DN1640_c0_g1_i9:783-1592(-)